MHHMDGGVPHRVLRDLAKKYGPLMHLQLGEVSAVVVTSETAKQVLKTHDPAFASRPRLLAFDIICYDRKDIAFSPYGEYWRQMRKICIMEVFSAKNVRSFSSIRHDEVVRLIDSVLSSSSLGGSDMADIFPSYQFLHVFSGAKKKLLDAHRKDMFTAGTETSSTTIVWAMVEMLNNPRTFTKAQAEVRDAFRDKVTFNINDVEELKYLKLVIKEALRLHPPAPLLAPRECREETCINGYTIPVKIKVMVNVWALGRDPKHWDDAESFIPERFEQCSVDFLGNNFEYLPFGGGRRICPGISFGLANVYLPLAKLLYHFDWKLPTRVEPRDLDLTESDGIAVGRKSDLYLIATPYKP
ncbi:Cytochrome 71D6 [Capsicum chinense]|nr:Cytochrome 71D6 [Capsicum chinense]